MYIKNIAIKIHILYDSNINVKSVLRIDINDDVLG